MLIPIRSEDLHKEIRVTKIFVRERTRVVKGDRAPRFAVVGVQGGDVEIFQMHVRKSEIEAIAQAVGAEIVMLPRGKGENAGEGSGGGKRKRRGKGKRATKRDG